MPFVFALDFVAVRLCRVVVVVVVSSSWRGKLSPWGGRASSPGEGGDVVTVGRSGRLCVAGPPLMAVGRACLATCTTLGPRSIDQVTKKIEHKSATTADRQTLCK